MNLLDLLKPYGKRYSLEDLGIYLNPTETPPRNCTFVDQQASPIVVAGGNVTLFNYLVPAFRRGILKRLAVDPADPAAIPAITWSILRSGDPVPNYQLEQAPIGTIGIPDTVNVTYDREQLLQVRIFNAAAFNYEVFVRIVAWFWDEVPEAGR